CCSPATKAAPSTNDWGSSRFCGGRSGIGSDSARRSTYTILRWLSTPIYVGRTYRSTQGIRNSADVITLEMADDGGVRADTGLARKRNRQIRQAGAESTR